MDREFPQVGRLQSTRGFSLTGRPYVFETPIVPKGKRSAFKKKRAKGGKIIYDNPRARYHRNINLQGTNPKLRRNTPNVGANNNFGGGLSRGGYGDFTANSLERLQDRRIEAEANKIEQLVENELKKRNAIRRVNLPQIKDKREPPPLPPQVIKEVEAGEKGGVVEEPDSPRAVKEEDIPVGVSPVIQSYTKEEGKPKKSRLGQKDKRDLSSQALRDILAEEINVEFAGKGEFPEINIPERERGGEERYSLRRQRADISYEEPTLSGEESGATTESEFDPSEVQSPKPRRKRRGGRRRVLAEESDIEQLQRETIVPPKDTERVGGSKQDFDADLIPDIIGEGIGQTETELKKKSRRRKFLEGARKVFTNNPLTSSVGQDVVNELSGNDGAVWVDNPILEKELTQEEREFEIAGLDLE